ncbi:hypothetical protein ACFL20_09320 [Spirochaetota bacterium]
MKDIFVFKSLYKSLFIFTTIWGLSMILMWFRPRVEIFWKIIATIIFAFYTWFLFDGIKMGFSSFTQNWYVSIVDFLKEFLFFIFVNLLFLWPLSCILIFFKSDAIGSERLLKFMCIFTLILWIIFVVYMYFNTGIDKFFYDNLKEMVPGAK